MILSTETLQAFKPQEHKFKKTKPPELKNFTLLSMIGKGKFSKVYLVKKNDTSKIYAMKVIKKKVIQQNQVLENIITERNILVESKFPFIIQLHFSFQTKDKIYFILDYCGGGELYGYLQTKGHFNEEDIKFYSSQVILSLDYVHSLGIIYKDLKPENIIIFEDGFIKMTDFGLASHVSQDQYGVSGTPDYIAPEILKKQIHGQEIDWWTLGILLFELFTGTPPFSQQGYFKLFEKIQNTEPTYPPNMSNGLKSLIMGLVKKNPKERLGANGVNEIKNHEFFKNFDWNQLLKKQLKPPFVPDLEHKADVKYISEQFVNQKVLSDDNSSMNSRYQINIDGFSFVNGGVSPSSQLSDEKGCLLIRNEILEKCRKFNNSHAQLKSLDQPKPQIDIQSKSQLNSPTQNDLDQSSEFFMEELPFVRVLPSEPKKSQFANY